MTENRLAAFSRSAGASTRPSSGLSSSFPRAVVVVVPCTSRVFLLAIFFFVRFFDIPLGQCAVICHRWHDERHRPYLRYSWRWYLVHAVAKSVSHYKRAGVVLCGSLDPNRAKTVVCVLQAFGNKTVSYHGNL